ncbi:MAG: BlaI family transcriptional regulator [Candidatus Hydrogenedentota bacterium]
MPESAERLSRRERQIMDIVYANGNVTAADVHAALPDPPSYSTVRALLRILVDKGHLKHKKEGARYVYQATRPRTRAARAAMKRVLDTFFSGSPERAVAALLDVSDKDMSEDEYRRIIAVIEQAKQEGR